jgi:hypothetical protein
MTTRRGNQFLYRYSESGGILFSETQTKKRFALCKEALSSNKKYSTRFKYIYESQQDIEKVAITTDDDIDQFTLKYFQLQQFAWGGLYSTYKDFCSPVGAFYPFVRTRFNSHQAIDEGCIWIGGIDSFPLIYVANNIAKWVCPYSVGGFVRTEPFLPYAEARKILPRLANKKIYPDLDVPLAF